MSRTVILVGHCFPDRFMLKGEVKRLLDGVTIESVNSSKDLEKHIEPDVLLLVNRELDGRFETGESGIELIRDIAQRDDAPVAMLISNYEESQQQAVEAGAALGFGKSDLYEASTAEKLQAAVGA